MAKSHDTLSRRIRWFFIRPLAYQLDKIMSALSEIVAKTITDSTAALAAKQAQIDALTAENTSLKADSADAEAAVKSLTDFDATLTPGVQ